MNIKEYLSDPRTTYIAQEYARLRDELLSLDYLKQDGMDELVREEKEKISKQMNALEKQIKDILKEDSSHQKNVDEIILEVRAGAGGDEASMFARDLAAMYEKFALMLEYSFSTLALSMNDIDGYKEGVFRIQGKNVYNKFRFETGVHRVQRVPATEKSGRIHTSTASVAVLPMYKKSTVTLDMNDIKMEFSRSGGAGGQNVNKVESAVRMVHLPTGMEVRCTEERTQLRNRDRALAILTAKVEQEQQRQEAAEYASMRRGQIGTADRSEKIRTYNILQDRITDHRIKKSWSNVENILNGNLGAIIEKLNEAYQAEKEKTTIHTERNS